MESSTKMESPHRIRIPGRCARLWLVFHWRQCSFSNLSVHCDVFSKFSLEKSLIIWRNWAPKQFSRFVLFVVSSVLLFLSRLWQGWTVFLCSHQGGFGVRDKGNLIFYPSRKSISAIAARRGPGWELAPPPSRGHRPSQPNNRAARRGHVSSSGLLAPLKRYVAKMSLRKALHDCFLPSAHPVSPCSH